MVSRRHCWAIPPNRCSASRGNRGYWDSEKDLLEVFSRNCRANELCSDCWDSEKGLLEVFSTGCPASQVFPDCWDSEKDLLEVFSTGFPASQVFPDCWDSEKDLLEVFSICCPASQVFPDCWDSEKDLLEVFSICCPASQVSSDCWDSEKGRLEVFSVCCPANKFQADIPSHQTLQQEAQSNSCFPTPNNHSDHLQKIGFLLLFFHCQSLARVPSNCSFPGLPIRCLDIHLCGSPSRLPGEMPREAWWDRCFWGLGRKGIRGCERVLVFVAVFAAMSVVVSKF